MNIYRTFTLNRIEYIAIPNSTGVQILDKKGNTYGHWQTDYHFRSAVEQAAHRTIEGQDKLCSEPTGRAHLIVQTGELPQNTRF